MEFYEICNAGKVRASHSVALSYKHVQGLYSTLVTVFSFLFIVLCVFSSAAVIDYSVRNEFVVGIANAEAFNRVRWKTYMMS